MRHPLLFCPVLMAFLALYGCDDVAVDNAHSNATEDPESSTLVQGPFTVGVGDRSLSLKWEAVPDADTYHLYQSSEPFVDFNNYGIYADSKVTLNVSSPVHLTDLRNHQYRTYILTASIDGQEIILGDPLHLHPRGAEPTDQEVRMMELVNRARKDPEAEALRYGIALNKDLAPGTISPDSKAPLAFNIPLMLASRDHSAWMLDTDTFSHTGEDSSSVGDRAEAAGYILTAPGGLGENLAWSGTTAPSIDLTSAIEEHHEGLFKSEGHRLNILHEDFRESGVGQRQGRFILDGTNYNSSIVTNKFGYSGDRYFLTGVAFEAAESDGLYQVGSALEEVWIHLDDYRYAPYASGAFSVLLAPGSYEFSVSVAGEAVGIPEIITLTDENIKRDVVKHGGSIHIRDN